MEISMRGLQERRKLQLESMHLGRVHYIMGEDKAGHRVALLDLCSPTNERPTQRMSVASKGLVNER